jgi:hypothetical protein
LPRGWCDPQTTQIRYSACFVIFKAKVLLLWSGRGMRPGQDPDQWVWSAVKASRSMEASCAAIYAASMTSIGCWEVLPSTVVTLLC